MADPMMDARTSDTGSRMGQKFPSPFFDIASLYLPPRVKDLFKYCQTYAFSDEIISATIYKLAQFPITDLVYDSGDDELNSRWKRVLEEDLGIRTKLEEAGLDYHTYGNYLASFYVPFLRFLVCPHCKRTTPIKSAKFKWNVKDFKFYMRCSGCSPNEPIPMVVVDKPVSKTTSGMNIVRWDPAQIDIEHNAISGNATYYYNIPNPLKRQIWSGRRRVLEETPLSFIMAAKEGARVELEPTNIIHIKRPSMSYFDNGWGLPLIVPLLKSRYVYQTLIKAREIICVSPDTLIETDGGLKRADEVTSGTLVKTHLGRFKPVTHRADRGLRPLEKAFDIRLTTQRNVSATFSEDHPILSVPSDRRGSEPSFIPAKDVKVGDYVAYPVARQVIERPVVDIGKYVSRVCTERFVYKEACAGTAKSYEFMEDTDQSYSVNYGDRKSATEHLGVTTEEWKAAQGVFKRGHVRAFRVGRYAKLTRELAYLAGWYLGDGCTDRRHISIFCGPNEAADATQISDLFHRVFGARSKVVRRGSCHVVQVFDSVVTEFFRNWIPGDARTKKIPEEIEQAPEEILCAFLRGYIKADGCVYRGRISTVSANEELSMAVKRLATSLGVIGCISVAKPNLSVIATTGQVISGGKGYVVTFHGKSARRLAALVGFIEEEPVPVKSGKAGFFAGGYFMARVSSADEVTVERVIDFTVADDHTFCVAGMATHNCNQHITPMWMLYPLPQANLDPASTLSMAKWRQEIENSIKRWRRDPNHIAVFPIPTGFQQIGGDARALSVMDELRFLQETMIVGLQVPREFLLGGLSWSGSSVTFRMVENFFLNHIRGLRQLTRFVIDKVSKATKLKPIDVSMTRLKWVDDVQQKSLLMQANSNGKVSDSTFVSELGHSMTKEFQKITDEIDKRAKIQEAQMKAQAHAEGEAALIQTRYQVKAQLEAAKAQRDVASEYQAMGFTPQEIQGMMNSLSSQKPGGGSFTPGGVLKKEPNVAGTDGKSMQNPELWAGQYVSTLSGLLPADRDQALMRLQMENPQLHAVVSAKLMEANGVDSRPNPEQRPPTRNAGRTPTPSQK